MEIYGDVKNYDWGKLGEESFVAKIAACHDRRFVLDPSKPYAELWMGDHSSGPSVVKATGEPLGATSGTKLSFLFKVLSIRKALSIQVHPNKVEAEKLHASFPDTYKDPNHKPELAIALTEFKAMCGFRPYEEIYTNLKSWPEIEVLLGADKLQMLKSGGEDALKDAYSTLMHSPPEDLKLCTTKMLAQIQAKTSRSDLEQLFLKLHEDFPNDVGLLSIFFLNILDLKPGQAIYLGANVPHAYLAGDCIECMACSDNVVRAGLTPKFKDVDTLLRLLDYSGSRAEDKIFHPVVADAQKRPHTRMFIPPVSDFSVAEIKIPKGVTGYELRNARGGCIVLVCAGKCAIESSSTGFRAELDFGSILFLPESEGDKFVLTIGESDGDFVAYQAMTNDFCIGGAKD
ncbi:mannose-6-phosphate isomerase [Toxorhynchites rutilus septentrionalis]|uniref:mannose-6-phosphate isomerase n=1 Tax=Toxorhynchites rutilus septentrionalis TaxID=329112 RepID=UPI0024797A5E|nr:mannose-6-phosphate isomerase [Toxorhynchites rutilus septentrionalis]